MTAQADSATAGPAPRGMAFVRTIILCFIAQNLGTGLAYGSFGPLLLANQQHFGVGRTAAVAGMSLVTLAIGLTAPSAGWFLNRLPIRTWMAIGAVANAAGYAGLALAPGFAFALPMYLLIGLGVALLSVLGPLTLVSRWAGVHRGRVLGIINLQLVLFIAPSAVAFLLVHAGRLPLLLGGAVAFVALLLLLPLIVEHPRPGSGAGGNEQPVARPARLDARTVLSSAAFWCITLAIGIDAGIGAAFMVHIVPFGTEHGWTLQQASGLLSVYSGAGMLGSLLVGWLIDRAGSVSTLALANLAYLVAFGLLALASPGVYYPAAILFGLFMVPLLTLHGAAMASIFGAEFASRAVGMGYAVKLPFMFGTAPLIAILFERSGSYRLPMLLCALAFALALPLIATAGWARRRSRIAGVAGPR